MSPVTITASGGDGSPARYRKTRPVRAALRSPESTWTSLTCAIKTMRRRYARTRRPLDGQRSTGGADGRARRSAITPRPGDQVREDLRRGPPEVDVGDGVEG